MISQICGDGNGHAPPATVRGLLSPVRVGPLSPTSWLATVAHIKHHGPVEDFYC